MTKAFGRNDIEITWKKSNMADVIKSKAGI